MKIKIERSTVVYNLPFSEDNEIPEFQAAILKFPSGSTIDIGSLCYLDREESTIFSDATKRRKTGRGRKVNIESIDNDRVKAVEKLIRHVADEMLHSSSRPETIRSRISRLIPFMDWVDKNGYTETLTSSDVSKYAFREYVKFLREKVNTNTISVNGAAKQQFTVLKLLEQIFDDDTFAYGVNLIRTNSASKISTSPPDEESQAKILSLCDHLFESMSSFIIESKSYPFPLNVPSFINYPNNKLWIFPTTRWFKHPDLHLDRFIAYNYIEGRIYTESEVREIPQKTKKVLYRIKRAVNRANQQIEASNKNIHDIHRLNQAMNALNFFTILFFAETGMNLSQLINLTWSDDFEIEPSRQLFRIIKWRAHNKTVNFEVSSSFIPKFKKFLSIRKYLLQGNECQWLFFNRGNKRTAEPTQAKGALKYTYDILNKIHPGLIPIKSRQWRSAKGDWLIRNTDPATTALILQNSEKTVLTSYAAGSETSQIEEISNFLNELSNTVTQKETKIVDATPQSLGSCVDYGFPIQSKPNTTIKADCKKPEGCLFCEKFRIHADEIDTRKLISCRYCINQTTYFTQSTKFYEDSVAPILIRIAELLAEITKRDSTLVDKVTKEVEVFGELDEYWRRKFELLIELGIAK